MTDLVRPEDLAPPGAELWDAVVSAYELDPTEVALLHEACRVTDELERLAVELATAPLVVPGSTGQDRANPILDELRKHRALLVTVIGALRLPADGERVGRSSASARGSAAARARWNPTVVERAERKGRRGEAS